jgi:hypothetical protein
MKVEANAEAEDESLIARNRAVQALATAFQWWDEVLFREEKSKKNGTPNQVEKGPRNGKASTFP